MNETPKHLQSTEQMKPLHLIILRGLERLNQSITAILHIWQMLPHLLPELILLNELLEFLSQLHVLLPQFAVMQVVLLHLGLNLIERHLEVQRCLLAPLFILPEPLRVLLLLSPTVIWLN